MVDGEPVSSSAIRAALQNGDARAAARGLGRPYSLRGLVVRGEGRGRQLGFPTANLAVASSDKLIPAAGVYAVSGTIRAGTFGGALHLGPRPTFSGSPPSIELYLLDFDGDLYGEEIRVDFIQRLRDVQRFDSAAALIAQMREDVEEARRVLDDERRRTPTG
jgi:riboflavin kinase/FMN adenylyltransferase